MHYNDTKQKLCNCVLFTVRGIAIHFCALQKVNVNDTVYKVVLYVQVAKRGNRDNIFLVFLIKSTHIKLPKTVQQPHPPSLCFSSLRKSIYYQLHNSCSSCHFMSQSNQEGLHSLCKKKQNLQ